MSAQTELLREVVDQVNRIGADDNETVGLLEINNTLQAVVDDPDGEEVMVVCMKQVEMAIRAAAQLGYGPMMIITGSWLDGFIVGANYMRTRMEKGL